MLNANRHSFVTIIGNQHLYTAVPQFDFTFTDLTGRSIIPMVVLIETTTVVTSGFHNSSAKLKSVLYILYLVNNLQGKQKTYSGCIFHVEIVQGEIDSQGVQVYFSNKTESFKREESGLSVLNIKW
jgi:hypothetical protein